MSNGFIRGLDGKLYGIIDGELSEVVFIKEDEYNKLSEDEQGNGKIYVLDRSKEEKNG